ncbi:hypothetical protein EL26_24240 [Tumebacillus flagellatus]|uniref:DUF5643 domain-containing protein n=1 Tax=Tumebacillus flagellatus TaxID=1157490 RepID=A0A074LF00_9BACL|nr:hypothetical protein EL26_24240 [Tumebacillus flagellatus]
MVTSLNQSKDCQGYTVNLTSVYYDGPTLYVGYSVKVSAVSEKEVPIPEWEVVDSRELTRYSFTNDIVNRAQGTLTGVLSLRLHGDRPKSFQLNLEAKKIGTIQSNGELKFSIPVSREKIAPTLYEGSPEISKTFGDLTITTRKLVMTPTVTDLSVQVKGPRAKSLVFRVEDSAETYLDTGNSSSRPYMESYLYHVSLPSLDLNQTPYLILQAGYRQYVFGQDKKTYDLSLSTKYPIVLPHLPGEVQIQGINALPDKTILTYSVRKPENQMQEFLLEDGEGKQYAPLSNYPKRVDRKTYTYQLEYPKVALTRGSKLRYTVIYKDGKPVEPTKFPYEIKIPIKK